MASSAVRGIRRHDNGFPLPLKRSMGNQASRVFAVWSRSYRHDASTVDGGRQGSENVFTNQTHQNALNDELGSFETAS